MKLALKEIKPNPLNPRTIHDDSFKKLVTSLKEFPEMAEVREIVLNKDHVILGGNMRFKAMQEAGWKEAPVKIVDWPEDKQREFIIKDNVSGGEWDWDVIANEWDADLLDAWGLDLPAGFGDDEVEEDEAPELSPDPPQSVLGAVYQLGRHRVMCGDSTDFGQVSDLMDGNIAQLLLTSPPYGVGMEYEDKNPDYNKTKQLVTDVFNNYKPTVTDNGFAFINFGERFSFPQMMGQLYRDIFSDWHFYDMRYWKRSTVGMAIWNTTQPRCMSDMESLFTWQNGKKLYPVHNLDISKQSLWQADGSSAGMNHPAVMAVGIAGNAISIYTVKNDLVVDPFGGAGTTLIACEQLDRTCYMMELDPKYCDVIRKRYAKFTTPDNQLPDNWEELTPRVN